MNKRECMSNKTDICLFVYIVQGVNGMACLGTGLHFCYVSLTHFILDLIIFGIWTNKLDNTSKRTVITEAIEITIKRQK